MHYCYCTWSVLRNRRERGRIVALLHEVSLTSICDFVANDNVTTTRVDVVKQANSWLNEVVDRSQFVEHLLKSPVWI
jgi:hypothetical protein